MTAQIIYLAQSRLNGDYSMADDMADYLEHVTSGEAQAMHDHQDSEIARCAQARAAREAKERVPVVAQLLGLLGLKARGLQ